MEFERDKLVTRWKYLIYRGLVAFFVGIALSCSHQTLHWLLSLISNEDSETSMQSVIYYALEAICFFVVSPFAIISDNVLIISSCLLIQLTFYLLIITALDSFVDSSFLQQKIKYNIRVIDRLIIRYFVTVLFALSRSILIGRLTVMVKNWFSKNKLILTIGLTYLFNELFTILSKYWDNLSDNNLNGSKDSILFICLLLSSMLGLIIQGKPSIMGLREISQTSINGDSLATVEDSLYHQGIVSNFNKVDASFMSQLLEKEDSGDSRVLSVIAHLKHLRKIQFYAFSAVCLKLFCWYTSEQMNAIINQYKGDFGYYMLNLGMLTLGSIIGTIILGLLLDVYDKVFTLRMAGLTFVGLSASYLSSLLLNSGIISDTTFMFAAGLFELSFYSIYQIGVPIVLVFDLMSLGNFSYLIIPLFCGLDRVVNALYNLFNDNPYAWTSSSTVIQPICIGLLISSLLLQYRQTTFEAEESEKKNRMSESPNKGKKRSRMNSEFGMTFSQDNIADASFLVEQMEVSKDHLHRNFKISVSSDDEDASPPNKDKHTPKQSLAHPRKLKVYSTVSSIHADS